MQQTTTEKTVPIPGLRRDKTVKKSVIWADRLADRIITIGGILVIVAVLGILVFLTVETLPLFRSGQTTGQFRYQLHDPPPVILGAGMDEYHTLTYMLLPDGRIRVFHTRTGYEMNPLHISADGAAITASADSMDQESLALGFSDGTIRIAATSFDMSVIPESDLPSGLTKIDDVDQTDGDTVFSRITGDQYRLIRFRATVEEPIPSSPTGQPITNLAFQSSGEAERQTRALVSLDKSGYLSMNRVQEKVNLMTGIKKTEIEDIRLPPLPKDIRISVIRLSELVDTLLVACEDGRLFRYNLQNTATPVLAETTRVLPAGQTLTVCEYLLGSQSLLVGGSDGSLNLFFTIIEPQMGTADKRVMVKAREFTPMTAPVVRISAATRGKTFAQSTTAGSIRVAHATSQKTLLTIEPQTPSPPLALLLAPRMDGVFYLSQSGEASLVQFSTPHPETSFQTLFQRVWYEGYTEPTFTWQSSGASDSFEPKLSLIPLIFGSVKAAMYSLLFAVPIALLAAIYTSEFVHPKIRDILKPIMEIMASLPSVVLGFVAALVLAPVVENWIAAILLSFILIPVIMLTGSLFWQFIPLHLTARHGGIFRVIGAMLLLFVMAGITILLTPGFEAFFFQGDFKSWLTGNTGDALPFLFLILLPVSALITGLFYSRFVNTWLMTIYGRNSLLAASVMDVGKWVFLSVMTMGVSFLMARIMSRYGFDLRGSLVGTYVQRNTLVVGFAMGFAVIPIIYTIAEDALNSVPNHLRAASLGCGATQWQTTIYVVLPAALSGVFSAVMIGLGRAVGETMIVVMAAGNTPLIDLNIFNGLRALSATIAVELPEAVKDGTLYRVLFLSGLVLFAMTFVINTVAEVVRLRFRKRAAQL